MASKKTYPLRRRIRPEDAVNNIINWLENDDVLSKSDAEEDFSGDEIEEHEEGDEQQENEEENVPEENGVESNVDIEIANEPETNEIDTVEDAAPVIGGKRKRGRPSTTTKHPATAANANVPAAAAAPQRQQPNDNDTWEKIVGDEDIRLHEFRFIPAKVPGVLADLDSNSSAYKCFLELYSLEVQETLVILINEYAAHKLQENLPARQYSRFANWTPVTRYELLKLIAILIAMGIDRRPNLDDYWSMTTFNYTPWYHKIFSRNRFEALYSTMLHASSIGDEQSKKDKIEPFLNLLLENIQGAFYPGQDLSLDEMVVKWKGRSKYKMYNPNKPEKYHIKTFGLCDSATGYAYNLLIYFGKETSYKEGLEGGQSEKVFEYLLRPLGTGHHIFADRYYTTHSLVRYLTANKTYYTGTLMLNRKNFPPEIKNSKIKHLESKYYRSDAGILLCEWKDKKAKKPVVIVSTHATKGESEITTKRGIVLSKPCIIQSYNNAMNGCDRMDQMLSYYNIFNRKTIKWWKRMFMWCLEVCQVNTYIMFCMTRDADANPVPLLKFKQMLVEEILFEADQIVPADHKHHRIQRPNVPATFGAQNTHLVIWHKDDRNCAFCSVPGQRKRTAFKCNTCDVYLHPKNCFEQFHSKNN